MLVGIEIHLTMTAGDFQLFLTEIVPVLIGLFEYVATVGTDKTVCMFCVFWAEHLMAITSFIAPFLWHWVSRIPEAIVSPIVQVFVKHTRTVSKTAVPAGILNGITQ